MKDKFHFTTIFDLEAARSIVKRENAVSLNQIHGNDVLAITGENGELSHPLNYDGMVSDQKNIFLVIKHADCAPVFLFSPAGEIIGLLHCGWRSVQKDIVNQAKKIIEKKFQFKKKIFFSIGPMICAKCYVVKQDLVEKFNGMIKEYRLNAKDYFSPSISKGDEFFFDLKNLIHDICLKNGFYSQESSSICTKEELQYFSHRRNKTKERNISYIVKG